MKDRLRTLLNTIPTQVHRLIECENREGYEKSYFNTRQYISGVINS